MKIIFAFVSLLLAAHASATLPTITTIDAATHAGSHNSMQLLNGSPVVSYYDEANGALKLAICASDCGGANPAWSISTVDADGNVGGFTSLGLRGTNPVIAYYDFTNRAIKLATCTAGCSAAGATWIITTVDHAGAIPTSIYDDGALPSAPSLQLNDAGNPVIAYADKGWLKVATCTAACETATPVWAITTVDRARVALHVSMQLAGGRQIIAYYDAVDGSVQLATCTSACAAAMSTWTLALVARPDVDPYGDIVENDVTLYSLALRLRSGKPIVAFYDVNRNNLMLASCARECENASPVWTLAWSLWNVAPNIGIDVIALQVDGAGSVFIAFESSSALQLAVCVADCDSGDSAWNVKTLDEDARNGTNASLALDGGTVVTSYARNGLHVATIDAASAAVPANHTALWFDSAEPGWGLYLAHQGDIVFGVLFVYDASGQPMWLVLPKADRSGEYFYGTLYHPSRLSEPSSLTRAGSLSIQFAGDVAVVQYDIDHARFFGKQVKKQVFGRQAADCEPTTADRRAATNYQDLWWNPTDSGWGLGLAHQSDVIFATLFTYSSDRQPVWLVASAAAKRGDGTYAGALYRTQGTPFNRTPFKPLRPEDVTTVGAIELRFADGVTGTLSYSIDGASVTQPITRQTFSSPVPACSG
jgi:hypothetical protein